MSDSTRMPMQTPLDLFVHELSSIHSAEGIIVTMLNEVQGLVNHPQLQQGLQMHAQQSQEQAERLEQVFQQLGQQPHPIQCHSAEGLHQEIREVMAANPSAEVLQGAVVAGACKTEHLEIAAYTGLVEKAQAMGQAEVAQVLQQNLQEEQQMLQQVEQIARELTQQMAQQGGGTSA